MDLRGICMLNILNWEDIFEKKPNKDGHLLKYVVDQQKLVRQQLIALDHVWSSVLYERPISYCKLTVWKYACASEPARHTHLEKLLIVSLGFPKFSA